MVNRASDNRLSKDQRKNCLFTIPAIIPGVGKVNQRAAMFIIADRIRRRGHLEVVPRETEEAFTIFVSWEQE